MEIQEVGLCVKIGDRFIPAVNIQVEGVPGYLTHTDGTKAWYGMYFEVMFEDGTRWIVEVGFEDDPKGIYVLQYDDADETYVYKWQASTWEQFLDVYDVKTRVRHGGAM